MFDRQDLRGALVQSALWAFVLQVAGVILKYVAFMFFARWVGAKEYGMFAFVLTLSRILGLIGTLGLFTAVLRFIPEYISRKDWPALRGFLPWAEGVSLGAGAGIALLGSLWVLLVSPAGYRRETLLLGMWMIPLMGLMFLNREAIRALKRIPWAYGPPMVLQPLLAFGFVAATLSLHHTSLGITALWELSIALVILLQLRLLHRFLPPQVHHSRPRYLPRTWLRVSLPLLITSGATLVITHVDILMVGALIGPEEAGIYMVGVRTASFLSFLLSAVMALAAPLLASYHHQGDRVRLQRLVRVSLHLAFWPALMLALGLFGFRVSLLRLFGEPFVRGQWALTILLGGQLINIATGPVYYLVNLTGYQDEGALAQGISALLNILLNALLIPLWGMEGAALASALSIALWKLWLVRIARRRLGVQAFLFAPVR